MVRHKIVLFLSAKQWKTRTNTKLPLFLIMRQNLLHHLCWNLHFQIFNQYLPTIPLYTFSSSVVICASNYLSEWTNFHTLSHPVLLSSCMSSPPTLNLLYQSKTLQLFHVTLSLCWHLQLHSHFCLNLPEGWCKCAAPVMHHTHTCTNTPTPLLMLVCFTTTNAQGTTRHITTHPCLVTLQSLHKVMSVWTFWYINCSTMQIIKFTAILSDLYPVIQISIYFNWCFLR